MTKRERQVSVMTLGPRTLCLKPALVGAVFEQSLQDAGFDRLVCVSGWAGIAAAEALNVPVAERGRWLHRIVDTAFPSTSGF